MKNLPIILKSLLLILFFAIHNKVSAQNFNQSFNDFLSSNDTIQQYKLLAQWEKSKPNDPELYVAYFNYYFSKSKSEVIRIGNNPQGENPIKLTSDSTGDRSVGYLYSEILYNDKLVDSGLFWINKGINNYPNRLDMRFGKTYVFGETQNYELFTQEILNTIDYSIINKNEWTWTNNEPIKDPKEFMLSSIQSYQAQLFNTGKDSLLNNIAIIANKILINEPNHVESLSNLSVVYISNNKYDLALKYLLQAYAINPKDYIVLNNIAHTYKLMGDNKNAINYFKLTKKYGDKQAKASATEELKKLDR